jgi:hypothetical protein
VLHGAEAVDALNEELVDTGDQDLLTMLTWSDASSGY